MENIVYGILGVVPSLINFFTPHYSTQKGFLRGLLYGIELLSVLTSIGDKKIFKMPLKKGKPPI